MLFYLNAFVFIYNFISEHIIPSHSSEFKRHKRGGTEDPSLPRGNPSAISHVSFQRISALHPAQPCLLFGTNNNIFYALSCSLLFSHKVEQSLENTPCLSRVLIPFFMVP